MKALSRLLFMLGMLAWPGLAAGPALAQTGRLEPPDLERYLRWGPLRVRPGFQVSNLGYDDNILFSNAQQTVSDYTATVSPRAEGVVLLGHRGFVTFDAQAGYTAYADNDELNFFNHEETVRLTVPVRRLGVFLESGYGDEQLRPVDREDVRAERRTIDRRAGLVLQPGWRTEIEIGARRQDFDYDDRDFVQGQAPISQRLDREERGTTLDIRYQAHGRLVLLADALRQSISFDQNLFDSPEFGDIARDTREWQARAGIEFGEGGPLSGELRVGWGRINAEDPRLPDFSELVGEAELTYRFNRYTWVRLDSRRRPGFAVSEGNAYYLDTRNELRAVRFLNRFLGLEASVGEGTLAFPAALNGFEREDDISTWDTGLRLRLSETGLGRRVEYRVRYQHYERDSNTAFANQERSSVGVTAVFGY